ncbi:TRAP transporter large permease [Acuticoccus mangrovi]|uniref:TRAP transporter large permease protein n=1 Tax=Acuticoccus mangrovi TaxID=2796142 RepID=A0A934ISA8_9HYPH|nr:TRAP transporter large permease [Acuticoccus mangrovi]MBJ3777135.1 TRAP transporter large permease [Acuticoccus mangrovi]
MIWLVILGGLGVIALTGVPVGIGLGLIGLVILHFLAGGAESLAVTAVWNVFTDATMSSVPAFIVMGELLLYSGLGRRVYSSMEPFFRRYPGGLLHTNIAVSTLFGSVAGSSTATAAAIGSVAYPVLAQKGYPRPAIVGSLAAGGTLGLLIPPSNTLLVYGATQNVSIGKLFVAGILPGILLALMFMGVIAFLASRNKDMALRDTRTVTLRQKLLGLVDVLPLIALFTIVIGSIVFGIATPTESAGVGVLAAILLGVVWGDLTLKLIWKSFVAGAVAFGAIGLVVVGALVLAQAISILGAPQQIITSISHSGLSATSVFFVIVAIYILLGCFFDGLSLLLMTTPLVYPLLTRLGFDPVWLGVMITVLIEIGMITPPVGMNLFVLSAISKNEVSLISASRASLPYFVVMLIAVVLFTTFPQIILFLPNLMSTL